MVVGLRFTFLRYGLCDRADVRSVRMDSSSGQSLADDECASAQNRHHVSTISKSRETHEFPSSLSKVNHFCNLNLGSFNISIVSFMLC
jgi:hypothetical protein